jgi:thiamine-phosphate pyrophosphorylase
MELILISYPDFFKGETDVVSSLLNRYDFTFHLRKPLAKTDDLIDYLNNIPKHLHYKIVLHNDIESFKKFNLKGMHFSTVNREKAGFLNNQIHKGTSCHSISEIKCLNTDFDYAFLSPIFPSISKKGYSGNLDKQAIQDFLKEKRQSKVIALGGIDANKIAEIGEYKFDGLAVLGAVWEDNPSENLNEIISNFTEIYTQIHP